MLRYLIAAPLLLIALPDAVLMAQASTQLSATTQVDTSITPGATHEYSMPLARGASADVEVMQNGVDLIAEIRDARDSVILTVDSPNGRSGPELVHFMAPSSGTYRFVVRPYDDREPPGRYVLSVTAWRDARATRLLLESQKLERLDAARWLRARSTALPRLNTSPATGTLPPVDSLAVRSTVIGIGEATHGSREFGELRLMLTRYLVENHGYRLVGIENSTSRLAALDRYVQGSGDYASIIPVLESGWIGRRPLRELVRWLRDWNDRHSDAPVHLVGIDPQDNEIARRELRAFVVAAYPAATLQFDIVERELAAADSQALVFGDGSINTNARRFLRDVVAQGELDAVVLRSLMNPSVVEKGLAAAQLMLQVADFNNDSSDIWSHSRDWYMARNLVNAIASMGPGTKAVVWSHNAHVAAPADRSTRGQPMGSWLRSALGCGYAALGVSFGEGDFVAQIPNDLEDDLTVSTLPMSPPESIDAVLASVNPGGTIAAWPCGSAASAPEWLQGPRPMHWVGALFTPGTDPALSFRDFRVLDEFDGIAFIPRTTADELPTDRPLVPARKR